MSFRTRSSLLIASLAVGGLGCPAPSTNTDGSSNPSSNGSSDGPTEESGEGSTAGGDRADSSGSDGVGTDDPGLEPTAQCIDIADLAFEDLIDGVAPGVVLLDARPFDVTEVELAELDGGLSIAALVGANVLLIPLDDSGEAPTGQIQWIDGATVYEGETRDIGLDEETGTITVGPVVVTNASGDATATVSSCFGFGFGSSRFSIDGTAATLDGTLGSITFAQVEAIVAAHPDLETLVLRQVPGSVNDEVNVETGRLVRDAGWNTFVPADGEIASGGVDLFCAGVGRDIEAGAQLGVHSWSDGVMDGADYPPDDPAHHAQLAYFTEMLGDPLGPDFYWFTLAAAPADDIHWMTEREIATYELLAP